MEKYPEECFTRRHDSAPITPLEYECVEKAIKFLGSLMRQEREERGYDHTGRPKDEK